MSSEAELVDSLNEIVKTQLCEGRSFPLYSVATAGPAKRFKAFRTQYWEWRAVASGPRRSGSGPAPAGYHRWRSGVALPAVVANTAE